jgi:flagellar biosynthesis protein FlhG
MDKLDMRMLTIGGGKGGTGKSVIATNLAVALAEKGKDTVLIDNDLGGANLHTLLGIMSPPHSLSEFILGKKTSLEEIQVDTGIDHLRFISGAGDVPGIANIYYSRKLKLLRHLQKLEADYLILDLGAGISFNVLDFFSSADDGILVTTPELTSLMNTYTFLKGVMFRKLEKAFKEYPEIAELVKTAEAADNEERIGSVDALIERAREYDSDAESIFARNLSEFRPMLVVNRVRNPDESNALEVIEALARKYISIDVDNLGVVSEDPCVHDSISDMQPFMVRNPDSKAADCMRDIADKLVQ